MNTKSFHGAKNNRRKSALKRLIDQMTIGLKQPVGTVLTMDKVNIDENDKVRIRKEIAVLESRIVSDEVAASKRTKKYRGGQGFRN